MAMKCLGAFIMLANVILPTHLSALVAERLGIVNVTTPLRAKQTPRHDCADCSKLVEK